jgi:hypothetical protein
MKRIDKEQVVEMARAKARNDAEGGMEHHQLIAWGVCVEYANSWHDVYLGWVS